MVRPCSKGVSFETYPKKLKYRIKGFSAALFLASVLVIDVGNTYSGANNQTMLMFAKNIHWLAPWGLLYLLASSSRGLLKVFTPLYCSIMLLAVSGFQGISDYVKSERQYKMFEREIANLVTRQGLKPETKKAPYRFTYSTAVYGQWTPLLNTVKKLSDYSEQETNAMVRAFEEADIAGIFAFDVILDLEKINEKKSKLEELLVFLDQSDRMSKKVAADAARWFSSSPDVSKGFQKGFARGYLEASKDNEAFRKGSYDIKKKVVREHIDFLDFLSGIYGTYELVDGNVLTFSSQDDIAAYDAHLERIINVGQERG